MGGDGYLYAAGVRRCAQSNEVFWWGLGGGRGE